MANKDKLNAPLISHLGAVVNFSANRVSRAPLWMQNCGVEWLWRIAQEPRLWRRYAFDASFFAGRLLAGVLCFSLWRACHQQDLASKSPVRAFVQSPGDSLIIGIEGPCLGKTIGPLREIFRREVEKDLAVTLDLSRVPIIDCAFLGLCMVLRKHMDRRERPLLIEGLNITVKRIFHWNRAEWLL